MVGTWEWNHSASNCGTKYSNFCVWTPSSEGYTLTLRINKNGQYLKYKNDKEVEKGKIIMEDKLEVQPALILIHRSKEEHLWYMKVYGDTLVYLYGYPFEDAYNLFIRKK